MVLCSRLVFDPGQICLFQILKRSANMRFSAWHK